MGTSSSGSQSLFAQVTLGGKGVGKLLDTQADLMLSGPNRTDYESGKVGWDMIWLGKGLCAFILDQLAHLLVLVFWVIGREGVPSMQGTEQEFMWACAVAYVLVLLPSNVFIGLILQRWQVKMSLPSGLSGAGTLIGYLERILVLTFVLTGNIEAVGFLMTAKSVFRFGDLNKEHNLQATEYVLMGTLASFSIAVIVGVLLRALFPG